MTKMLRNFEKLERAKEGLLAELRGWPEARLRERMAAGSWSALEVVEHLVLVERSILVRMQAQVRKPQRMGIRDVAGSAMVLTIMMLPLRVPVPKGAEFVKPAGAALDLAALAERWGSVRRDLAEFLAGAGNVRGGVVRHPVGGWTTVTGALYFLRTHLRHHRYQIARIREAVASRS